MRIFVVSDTHGRTKEFIDRVDRMEKADLIIHLGDYVEDGLKIEKKTGIKTIIVRGNCDFLSPGYSEEEILNIEGKKIFITHGHKYNVKYRIDNLIYKGLEMEADMVLFGHTHVPVLHKESDIIIMNPGSPSVPRGVDRRKTFGIIDMGEGMDIRIEEID
ncbi:MAG: metallophosphoesterase [Tissierellia bacterium]|nr:metallophosphoesterase [Tissierellia bacterium]